MAGTVLIVDPKAGSRAQLTDWFEQAGFHARGVAGFEDAKPLLTPDWPDLLVTEVRLGAYNGLHLVILGQARHPSLAAIVIGQQDAVTEHEAGRYGALYLAHPITERDLLEHARRKLEEASRGRRWPRKHVAERLEAEVDHSLAKVVDLSYGGLCLEISEVEVSATLPAHLRVTLPAFGFAISMSPVWMSRRPSGSVWYGVAVSETDPQLAKAWRQLVDSIPG